MEHDDFEALLKAIIDFIFTLALVIVPIVIIVAGIFFITAQGDPEKINTAKKMILWAIIGLIIILCAKGFVEVIKEIFKPNG